MRHLFVLALSAALALAPVAPRRAHAAAALSSGQTAVAVVGGLLVLAGLSSIAAGAALDSQPRRHGSAAIPLIMAGIVGLIVGIIILPSNPANTAPQFLGLTEEAASRLSPAQQEAFEAERDELNCIAQEIYAEVSQAQPRTEEEGRELARRAWERELRTFSPTLREALEALAAHAQ